MVMMNSFLLDLIEGNSQQYNAMNHHLNQSRRATRLVIKTEDGKIQEEVIFDDDSAAAPFYDSDSNSSCSSTSFSDNEALKSESCQNIFNLSKYLIHQITIESDNAKTFSTSSTGSSSASTSTRNKSLKKRRSSKNAHKKASRWESQVSLSKQRSTDASAVPSKSLQPFAVKASHVSIMPGVIQQQQSKAVVDAQQSNSLVKLTTPSTLTHSPPSVPRRQLSFQSTDSSSSCCQSLTSRTWKAATSSGKNLMQNAVLPSRKEWTKPQVHFPDFIAMARGGSPRSTKSKNTTTSQISQQPPRFAATNPASSLPLRHPVRQPSRDFGSLNFDGEGSSSDFSVLMKGLTLDYLVSADDDENFEPLGCDQPPRQPMGVGGSRQGRRASMF